MYVHMCVMGVNMLVHFLYLVILDFKKRKCKKIKVAQDQEGPLNTDKDFFVHATATAIAARAAITIWGE